MTELEKFFAITTGTSMQALFPRTKQKTEHKCLLPECNVTTTHNGGYCCAEHCKEHRRITKAGLRAVVIMGQYDDGGDRHRCGYVGVDSKHPLYRVDYMNISPEKYLDVHGGVTYSDEGDYPVKSDGLWWFGYDCGHLEDKIKAPQGLSKYPRLFSHSFGVFRSLEYCIDECESLAEQLVKITKQEE